MIAVVCGEMKWLAVASGSGRTEKWAVVKTTTMEAEMTMAATKAGTEMVSTQAEMVAMELDAVKEAAGSTERAHSSMVVAAAVATRTAALETDVESGSHAGSVSSRHQQRTA